MASGAGKSAAFAILILNVILYFVVAAILGWAVNHGIHKARETASSLILLAQIFPIYFPIGNMATGFVIIFSLIAGVVGFCTSLTGIQNVVQWKLPNLHVAIASCLITWLLTLLATGLACKEIKMGFDRIKLDKPQTSPSRSKDGTESWMSVPQTTNP